MIWNLLCEQYLLLFILSSAKLCVELPSFDEKKITWINGKKHVLLTNINQFFIYCSKIFIQASATHCDWVSDKPSTDIILSFLFLEPDDLATLKFKSTHCFWLQISFNFFFLYFLAWNMIQQRVYWYNPRQHKYEHHNCDKSDYFEPLIVRIMCEKYFGFLVDLVFT